MDCEDSVFYNTQGAMKLVGPLSLEQFLKVNNETFITLKQQQGCFCTLHNAFHGVREYGMVLLNAQDLKKFYDFSQGGNVNDCTYLKLAIACLAKTEEDERQFLSSLQKENKCA